MKLTDIATLRPGMKVRFRNLSDVATLVERKADDSGWWIGGGPGGGGISDRALESDDWQIAHD